MGRSEKVGPFAGPLGLEARRGDDQPAPDAPGPPEDVARGDRLRGLAQAHVVGQEQSSRRQEALDPLALIRVERPLQALERRLQLGGGHRLLHDPFQPLALADQEGAEGRVGPVTPCAGGEQLQQRLDEGQAFRRIVREGSPHDEGPVIAPAEAARDLGPARRAPPVRPGRPEPVDASQPIPGAGQRPDRVPAEPGRGEDARRFLLLQRLLQESGPGVQVFEHGQDVLADAQRVLQEVGAVAAPSIGSTASQHRGIGPDVRLPPLRRVRAEQMPSPGPGVDAERVALDGLQPAAAGRPSPRPGPATPGAGRTASRAGPGPRPESWGSSARLVPGVSRTPRTARSPVRVRSSRRSSHRVIRGSRVVHSAARRIISIRGRRTPGRGRRPEPPLGGPVRLDPSGRGMPTGSGPGRYNGGRFPRPPEHDP